MIWKRRIFFARGPSDPGGTGPNQVPPKLQVGPEGLSQPEDSPQHEVVDSSEYAHKAAAALADGVLGQPGDGVLGPLETMFNIISFQANMTDTLQSVPHPINAKAYLEPAVNSVQKTWVLLSNVSADAISGISLPELGKRLAYVLYLRTLAELITTFATSLDNTIALAETGLVEMLRPIYDRTGSAYATNAKVHTKLENLYLLFTKGAQVAADQRKNNASVEARTRSQVETEMKMGTPTSEPGPASAPVPPPPAAPPAPPTHGHAAHPAGTGPGPVNAPSTRTSPRGSRKKKSKP